jgi:hypothetical protein
MRTLTRLWRAIERVPGLLAVPAFWQKEGGKEFGLLQPHLRPTDELGSNYPCPYPSGGDCPRKIIDHGDGEYVAICRDPHKLCPDVPLTGKEALLHELDLSDFLQAILQAASIRARTPQARGHGVWGVGLSNRRSSLNQPVFLIIVHTAAAFESAVNSLLADVPGQFLILAPTNRHRSVQVQERLQARNVGYLCLEEQVFVDEHGRFTTTDPVESADTVAATPIADRKRVVKEFTRKHRCKVVDIQKAAGVYETDYYDWLKGADPDHYAHCVRIEQILRQGLPKPTPQKFS